MRSSLRASMPAEETEQPGIARPTTGRTTRSESQEGSQEELVLLSDFFFGFFALSDFFDDVELSEVASDFFDSDFALLSEDVLESLEESDELDDFDEPPRASFL